MRQHRRLLYPYYRLGMMSKHYPETREIWDEVKRLKDLHHIIKSLKSNKSKNS